MVEKVYFDLPESVKPRPHVNSHWELVTVYGWGGEQIVYRCEFCGELAKADYAECPVCQRRMYDRREVSE